LEYRNLLARIEQVAKILAQGRLIPQRLRTQNQGRRRRIVLDWIEANSLLSKRETYPNGVLSGEQKATRIGES
jgi:hypothetical protein